ncbi:hypothetical protein [Mesorhizobium sp. IMUNJ 23232]|uniref:hypothetical protein n=1 Tax=Mesorhizobium sp. IMUNJ 23232 TaxID=3376064 RepID=UPI0037B3B46A
MSDKPKPLEYARLYLDAPPPGWHALGPHLAGDGEPKGQWLVLMVDVPYDDLKTCICRTAWLFVHPDEYRPQWGRIAQEAWVRVPGNHRSEKSAWEAFNAMLPDDEPAAEVAA